MAGLAVVLVTTGAVAVALADAAPPPEAVADEPVRERDAGSTGAPTPEATPEPTPEPEPEPPADIVFSLVAAGDVLPHEPVNSSARIEGGYDFAPLLAPSAPWIAGADLALCHLEVPVAPEGVAPSGYPLFGSPGEVVAGLAATGWDGCSTASNHSVDRGVAGVVATLDALDAAGLGHVGTARTAEEGALPQLYELTREERTVTVAHLAATYGTNGMPVPADAPWTVDLIDPAVIIERATAARTAGADLVLVSVHCCVEYVTEPTAEQAALAQTLADSGVVDLLIGHHAHVPQPIALLPGGPTGAGMWVAYGLGNYVSNQGSHCCSAKTDSGLLLTAEFTVPFEGPPTVSSVGWTGLTVDRGAGHRVEPLSALAATGSGVGTLSAAEVAARYERVVAAVGTEAPERLEPFAPTGPVPVVVPR